MRKFLEPRLEKVPGGDGTVDAAECGVVRFTTGECTGQESGVLLGNWGCLIQKCDSASYEISSDVLESIVRKSNLHGLIEVPSIRSVFVLRTFGFVRGA